MKDTQLKQLEKQIWDRLRQVLDPELNINLVDMGLIYKVEVEWDGDEKKSSRRPQIFIQMTLTTPGCPLAAMFDPMIREGLLGLTWGNESGDSTTPEKNQIIDTENDVEIELTFDPPWVIDMMSKEARAELGMD